MNAPLLPDYIDKSSQGLANSYVKILIIINTLTVEHCDNSGNSYINYISDKTVGYHGSAVLFPAHWWLSTGDTTCAGGWDQ